MRKKKERFRAHVISVPVVRGEGHAFSVPSMATSRVYECWSVPSAFELGGKKYVVRRESLFRPSRGLVLDLVRGLLGRPDEYWAYYLEGVPEPITYQQPAMITAEDLAAMDAEQITVKGIAKPVAERIEAEVRAGKLKLVVIVVIVAVMIAAMFLAPRLVAFFRGGG